MSSELKKIFLIPEAELDDKGQLSADGDAHVQGVAKRLMNQGATEIFFASNNSAGQKTGQMVGPLIGLSQKEAPLYPRSEDETDEEFQKRIERSVSIIDESWRPIAAVVAPREIINNITKKAGRTVPLKEGEIYVIISNRNGGMTYADSFSIPKESTVLRR